ncbi:ribonuclease H-like YkuK family protein [Texcoconibacillus texcoconensis]|uniref:RNAse n=1 Tax=Texcoconibacillus texcoconensis TaxID=1095777 RepID=A0A840QR05_9BACI|nr:ribonuclease H-like YkuK family protein [Texcoconibacillus texcoconensis]MBB5173753.1 hypothetical protein [Texcoconibacillus texcoconensis]
MIEVNPEKMVFQNLSNRRMNFEQVFEEIVQFMKQEPTADYRLMLGSDSQVFRNKTVFVTGIVIQRRGKGAWACIHKFIEPRAFLSLKEKISTETLLTEQIAYLFTEEKKSQLIDIILPYIYHGASFTMEGHIDIGSEKQNRTRFLVWEMMSRIQSTGLEAKIKPESLVASGYANRYTKSV